MAKVIYEPDAKILTILLEDGKCGYWHSTKCPQIMLGFSSRDDRVTAIKIWKIEWSPSKIGESRTRVGFGREITIDLL